MSFEIVEVELPVLSIIGLAVGAVVDWLVMDTGGMVALALIVVGYFIWLPHKLRSFDWSDSLTVVLPAIKFLVITMTVIGGAFYWVMSERSASPTAIYIVCMGTSLAMWIGGLLYSRAASS